MERFKKNNRDGNWHLNTKRTRRPKPARSSRSPRTARRPDGARQPPRKPRHRTPRSYDDNDYGEPSGIVAPKPVWPFW